MDLWMLLLVAIALGGLYLLGSSLTPLGSLKKTLRRSPRQQLLAACMGDAEKADRLVRYEKRRAPTTISDKEAVQRALERLQADRR